MAIQSDVGSFLVELSQTLESYKPEINPWVQTLRDRETLLEEELFKVSQRTILACTCAQNNPNFLQKASQKADNHLNPLKVLKELDKVLPENAILIADGGDFVGSAAYILRYQE